MAMLAGYSAAVTVNTIFQEPEIEERALEFYGGNYQRMWDVTRDFLHYFYAGNASAYPEDMFWKARSTLQLGDNVGARQAFCFLVNTIPGNPHPALRKQIHMFTQFMDNMEHPVNEFEEDEKLQELAMDKKTDYATFDELTSDAVPLVNGEIASSFQIDGESQTLKPVMGITYDENRPIFSSSASWLLGRNIHELDEEALAVLEYLNGSHTWSAVVAEYASKEDLELGAAEAQLKQVIQPLCEENIVLLRRPEVSIQASRAVAG